MLNTSGVCYWGGTYTAVIGNGWDPARPYNLNDHGKTGPYLILMNKYLIQLMLLMNKKYKVILFLKSCFFCSSFFCIYLFSLLDYAWWWSPLLVLTLDIGMICYLINNKMGSITYNLIHHKAISIALYITGSINLPLIQLIGIILFSHSSIDRVFHYSLKYKNNLKHTHLSD